MITVRNQIGTGKIRNYLLPSKLDGDSRIFFNRCSKINAIPQGPEQPLIGTHSWAIKTLLHSMLRNYFGNPNLSALFFPQVVYEGTQVRAESRYIDSPMLHWLVFCRFGDVDAATAEFWPTDYLVKSSIRVSPRNALVWEQQTGEERAKGAPPSPVAWLDMHGAGVLAGLQRVN